jgi:hypothetical protein
MDKLQDFLELHPDAASPPDALLNPRLCAALVAVSYPLSDYAEFSVVWPFSADDIAVAHTWLARNGLVSSGPVRT